MQRRNEQGAALITVMVIVIIATMLIVAMVSRQQLEIHRTETLLDLAQAYHYALGAEALARSVLASDTSLTPNLHYPAQSWARLHEGIPVEEGNMVFAIEDLQARFNLNTLVGGDAAPTARFRRLLALLKLPEQLVDNVIAYTQTGGTPHLFYSVEELREIDGINDEVMQALLPFITALPVIHSLLNVNTASDIVLSAYVPDKKQRIHIKEAFAKQGMLDQPALNAIGMNTKDMGVESFYFSMSAEVEIGGRRAHLTSMIERYEDAFGVMRFHTIRRDRRGNL